MLVLPILHVTGKRNAYSYRRYSAVSFLPGFVEYVWCGRTSIFDERVEKEVGVSCGWS
jgi:hypothetical protein